MKQSNHPSARTRKPIRRANDGAYRARRLEKNHATRIESKKRDASRPRTSPRASRHVHHTLGVVRIGIGILLPRFILDDGVAAAAVLTAVLTAGIFTVFARSRD